MGTIDIPNHFYNKVNEWQVKLPLIKNKGLLMSLSINDYDKKLSGLSKDQLSRLDSANKKLCMLWKESGFLSNKPRGLWGK